MTSTTISTLENTKEYFMSFEERDVIYPIQCVEKYFEEDKDIFYVTKQNIKALIFKENSILISSAQTIEKDETVYSIDKLYFKDIKKINLKEFGTYEGDIRKVLGGHLELTITIDGYEDIILNSKKDVWTYRDAHIIMRENNLQKIIEIFNKLK